MSNALIRRSLLEQLKSIGMCPDLANDEEAVRRVAEQFGFSRDEAARELVEMRAERGMDIFRKFGVAVPPREFLASLSTSRQVLAASAERSGAGSASKVTHFYDHHFAQNQASIGAALRDVRVPFGLRLRLGEELRRRDTLHRRRRSDRMDILGDFEFETERP